MDIFIGKWKTRDGRVAHVTHDIRGKSFFLWSGKLFDYGAGHWCKTWDRAGKYASDAGEHPEDLIEYLGPLDDEPPADQRYADQRYADQRYADQRYADLRRALDAAYEQASAGKGNDRHGHGARFEDQPIFDHIAHHGFGFATGQAEKKATEAHGLPRDAARDELLGAIVYLSAAWLAWPEEEED